jgi:two-component system CheB/CheR fusion protein
MRLVIDSARDYAIFALDPEGRVTSWNSGAERLFGWGEAEIVGQPGALLFTQEDRAEGVPEAEMRRAREEGRAVDERWLRRKDDSTFFCSGVMTPLHDDGALKGYAKIARDLRRRSATRNASVRCSRASRRPRPGSSRPRCSRTSSSPSCRTS